MTVLLPTSSGTSADQDVVPEAFPAAPVDVVNLTAVTPTLSLAVPLMWMVADEVETMVPPGETIRTDGAVVSVGGLGGGDAGGGAGGGGEGGVDGGGEGGGWLSLLPYRAWIPAISSSVSPVARR